MRRIIPRVLPLAIAIPSSIACMDGNLHDDRMSTSKSNKKPDTRQKKKAGHLDHLVILPGTSCPDLASEIAGHIGVKVGDVDIKMFTDGEVFCRVNEPIRGKDVFVIQTCAVPVNESIMEMLLTISCARRAGANRVTAVIPYFGYLHHRRGSPLSSKYSSRYMWSTTSDFAKMLTVMGVDRVISVDLQRPGQGQEACFFDNFIPVETIFSTNLMIDYIHEHIPLEEPVVIVSPDSDFSKKAHKFEKGLLAKGKLKNVSRAAFLHTEHHTGPVDPNASEFLGNVAGADVIIVDDVVDSGGTLSTLCTRLLREGARKVYLCASHGVFSGNSMELIRLSPVEKVVITDSIPLREGENHSKIVQVSVAPLLAQLIESEYYRSVGYKEETETYVLD
mmetsp:Transcript_20192/g.20292  ORF Transcript_20192/g.20292 Transcript_20192/m.20292 type:complete len:391 (-) Transcript_20192:122-1294(-)|eukprot:CAMPEP_0182419504 /NCGR_PEP_ID=MMETSP1167-20130531/3953_1 /TAXON_ID=2988 /ORGANISM="Mallomonas Sp, Strain CCMP3275" /LENGTH=390 /DNA_ID=CAMNT_0024594471 /DNA_START=14 /DNA_END=1186 /DNA_ORIENTATION=+